MLTTAQTAKNPTKDRFLENTDAAKLILSALKKISRGKIEIIMPDSEIFIFTGSEPGPLAKMKINNLQTFDMCIERSDIGLGEAYMQGFWETDNISNVIELVVANRHALQIAMYGIWYKIFIYKIKHMFNANSKKGSRKNIQAHYDLGNSFYKLWLDDSMTYSSAYWGENTELSLKEAQQNKYKLLLDQLNAKPGAHILEIGCGWGGFAEYAAAKGMHVTGITISKEQLDFATERIKQAGLQDRADIKFIDYRDIVGTFDHVVSIEMLEAVGQSYWSGYFKKIKTVLKPGGTAAIQSITIQDEIFDQYCKGTDFIQQYIFPGGVLPCERELKKIIQQLHSCEPKFSRFGLDYSRTLKLWSDAFASQKEKINALNYSSEFQKMWNFYLGYCEGAFRAGQINVVTMLYSV